MFKAIRATQNLLESSSFLRSEQDTMPSLFQYHLTLVVNISSVKAGEDGSDTGSVPVVVCPDLFSKARPRAVGSS
jgi:hypothetical protein